MRKNGLVIFIFVMVALVIYGVTSLNKKAEVAEDAETDIVVEMPTPATAPVAEASPQSGSSSDPSAFVGNDQSNKDAPATPAQWNQALKQMSQCLTLQETSVSENAEVSGDTFKSSMPSDFGEVIFQEDDWNAKDLRLPTGEKRRLLVQSFPSSSGISRRTLRYMSVDETGVQKDIQLETDQQNNPSDTLIASLESDGEIVSNTTAKKAFYQNGAEVVMVEGDGHLRSFEVTLDGRSFRCSDNLKSCVCP